MQQFAGYSNPTQRFRHAFIIIEVNKPIYSIKIIIVTKYSNEFYDFKAIKKSRVLGCQLWICQNGPVNK